MTKKKVKKSSSLTKEQLNVLLENENIINANIVDEIRTSILSYGLKTIVDRAIPDIHDGLKPVQRRILYTCFQGGFLPNKNYVKNAKIIGDTMGTYHPHGSSAIYEALVNMSKNWGYR